MRVVVVGCGRVGAAVAVSLARGNHAVAVVDVNPEAFERLGPLFPGERVAGGGIDRDVLLRAGIEHADALAALTADDNTNIIAARIAQNIFRVPKVIARVYDPRRAEIYQRLGLVTVSSTIWSVHRVSQLLEHHELDVVLTIDGGEVEVIELEAPPAWEGRAVDSVSAPGELLVVAITRRGKTMIPSSITLFQVGDRVAVATVPSAQHRLEAMLARG
jgi:trk/ktr system potassium uptake protein